MPTILNLKVYSPATPAQPAEAAPQVQVIQIPLPAPVSYPPPCPYYPQPIQPSVVIVNQRGSKSPISPPTPATPTPTPTPTPPSPKFSNFSTISVIVFALGLIFGAVCISNTYQTEEIRLQAEDGDLSEDEDYIITRTVAIGTGGAYALCFTIATLCSFYAGVKNTSKWSKEDRKKKEHCCMSGFVIAAWVIFCFTFITDLIILVWTFDEDKPVYPIVVW
eukprot:CAMPEP_0181119718 /NCGR_PEP_ID=MMETSP1071-20121207/23751_1 /TAXON_ID=35127 /ORGANISM="Thalassiosira sp., Strain NH16" /LENGTH=219 /DNA_ID=CAMNT_0023204283 /DNA_START=201 /DNA_END=857 /DNA_ORIENTATION=+